MKIQKHLKLKTLSSEQVDLETWSPKILEDIHICLDMGIRVKDIENEIVLTVTLASPEALRQRQIESTFADENEKHTVVVEKYDYDYVKKLLKVLISKCNRDTRYDSCIALQKYFQWNYDFQKHDSLY